MNTESEKQSLTGLASLLRWLRRIIISISLILVALYATSPFLVKMLSPTLGDQLGLNSLSLKIGYPRLKGLTIKKLEFHTDLYSVLGTDAEVEYSWSELLGGRINSLAFAVLDVTLYSKSDGAPVSSKSEQIIPSNPIDQLSAEHFVVRLPGTGFVGIGKASLGDGGLSLSMNGTEPEVASRFFVTADLSREGLFDVRVGEREKITAEFLNMRGALNGDTVNVIGNFNFHGYPLQLVSTLMGLPQGSGTVVGDIRTTLPWPLPEPFLWQNITATLPAITVDWKSAREDIEINAVSGSAELERGNVTALLSGLLRYRRNGNNYVAQLPEDYRLNYQEGKIGGTAGVQLSVQNGEIDAGAVLRSFSFDLSSFNADSSIALNTDADIRAKFDNVHVTGRTQVSLNGDELHIETDLHVNRIDTRETSETDSLLAGAGTVTARIETHLPSPRPESFSWQYLVATVPEFSMSWKSVANNLQVDTISGSANFEQGIVSARVDGGARYRLNGNEIVVQLPEDYRLKYAQSTVSGAAGVRLAMNENNAAVNTTLGAFTLRVAPTIRLDISADIDSNIGTVHTAGQMNGYISLEDRSGRHATGKLDFNGSLNTQSQQHSGLLNSTFRIVDNNLVAHGSLSWGIFDTLPFVLNHRLETGAGTLNVADTVNVQQKLAETLIPDWHEVYDLDSGQLVVALKLHWQVLDIIAADMVVTINNGNAHHKDYIASGISGDINFQADDLFRKNGWRLTSAPLSIQRIDIGIPVDEVQVRLAWAGTSVDIAQAHGNFLGGSISAAPFSYDLLTGSADIDLTLTGIDLARVLALEGDDITGSGVINGRLPVIVSNRQIRVENGMVTSKAPGGTIQLTSEVPTTDQQASLTFALLALKDFTYSTLETDIDYAENGDLRLAVHLEGSNPAIESGRPIRYNLNISENLPVLLRSLRLKDSLTEHIEKEIKK